MGSEAEAPWRRLHPASLAVNLVPTAWRTLTRVWPLLLALVVQRSVQSSVQGAMDLGFIGFFFLLAAGRTVLHFATLRYRFAHGRLEIQQGLLSRVERALDPARIQNVAIVQNLFHRLAGLVELRVEMAGVAGSATDGLLSALSVAEAEALRQQLGQAGAPVDAAAHDVEPHDRIGLLEVVAYGVSAGRVGAAAVAIGIGMDVMNQVAPGAVPASASAMGKLAWVGLGLVGVAGGYGISVGSAILRWYGARWWQTGDILHFEAGLLTRRRMDIPLRKLQMVQVSEPILRRWMGYATLLFDTAANSGPPTAGVVPTEGFVPMVAHEEVVDRVARAFPALDTPIEGHLLPCAPRAVGRAVLRGTLRWLAIAAAVHAFAHAPFVWALVPAGALFAWLDARRQGWQVTDRFIVVRRGFLSRDTWVLPREKVQSLRWTQGPVQRLSGLGTVTVWFPGGRLPLPDVRVADAQAVFARLQAR